MIEPTGEQVEAERERAHELGLTFSMNLCVIWASTSPAPRRHNERCTAIATALARVRIEAHAAGRNEGLDRAVSAVLTTGSYADRIDIADAIRALRGAKP